MVVTGGTRHVAPPLRLTRRGKVVLFGLFLLMAVLSSAVLFATASHG
ncbi:hypothetical protein BJY16_000325 [Actinoplanes octamycinicus]|uniref:Uncharacterized protein n=1 Tax=Actinoplanes octamycinicus TaxID=135948 RepID=A0A7W7GR99_9ACTN|nr:hypothetical protein [Actinoplanes octamycinicus]MBB4736866.1 hypothetical protein [Actinoplanes octamycinicus]